MMTERHEDVIPKPISINSAQTSKTKASSVHSQSLGRSEDEGLEYYMKHDEEKSRKQKMGFFQRLGLKKKQQKHQPLDEEEQQRIVDELEVEEAVIVRDEYNVEEEDADSSSTISSDHSEVMPPSSNASIYSGKYIKTKTKHKKHNQEFSRLVLAQTIPTRFDVPSQDMSSEAEPGPNHPYGALWVLKFSKDGRYLATAGQSCAVHIWRLISNQENEGIHVLDETPWKEYRGHTADILDLAWSKNNFLLSSSMDNTVRLWHIEKNVCLCVFRHLNFVTSIQFHPKDDRFFLSGSMDGRVRIWNIPEKSVAFWNEIPGDRFVTAVGFTLDGKMVTAGSHDGRVYFFETQGLKYNTQISVVNDNGRNSSYSKKGPKITGIEVMPGMPPGEEKILVSSNDSKMRLYNMKDKSLMFKYKGVVNSSLQIKAGFSDDGQYIISGSEDCHVYIWRTEQASVNPFHHLQEARNKAISALEHVNEATFHINAFQQHNIQQQPKRIGKWLKKRNNDDNNNNQGNDDSHNKIRSRTEYFEAHDYIVTSAAFAPSKTRHHIANSKLDTIYNNTPQRRLSSSSTSSFYYSQENVGHIIVTADYRGVIKVWRVDSSSSYTPKKKQGETLSIPSTDTSASGNSKSAPSSPAVKRNFGIFGNRPTK